MTHGCPVLPTTASLPPERAAVRRPIRATATGASSVRYPCTPRSRLLLVTAILLSGSIHAGIIFGLGRHPRKNAVPRKEENLIALTITIPQLKELDDPEPVPQDESRKEDLSVAVPMQADLPTVPRPEDFVQQLDFASLVEKPDFSKMSLLTIPENRHPAGMAEKLGAIFNLADLDRVPEPMTQQSPIYPANLRREGLTATVIVQFLVDTQGRVSDPYVVDTADLRFNDAATNGVLKWRFRPGIRAGKKVITRMQVPIVFKVAEASLD
jgi:protein TonB